MLTIQRRLLGADTGHDDPGECCLLAADFGLAALDQVDATSQYLMETYLSGGEATIIAPIGRIPISAARRREQALSPFQPRLTERQFSPWGYQALSPYQKRLTDRQLRR